MQTSHPPSRDASFFEALERIDSPIFVIERIEGDRFRFAHINSFFQRIGDLDPVAMTSAAVDEVLPPRMAAFLTATYLRALSQDEPVHCDAALRLSGKTITWRMTLSRAPHSPAGRERLIGVAMPVQDLKDREVQLAREVATLRNRIDELRTLGRLAAHDLRAPLANVTSLTEIVLEDFRDLGNGKSDMIRICNEVATTALGEIGTLMDRFRDDPAPAGRHDVADLGSICYSLAALADPTSRLAIVHPDTRILCDSMVVNVTLRNLIDNAARFARSRIEIDLRPNEANDGLVITVADDGPGFPEGSDPIRLARSGEERSDGRGFGLGAVLSLLQTRGGELRLAPPRLGRGATFEIALPGEILEPVIEFSELSEERATRRSEVAG